MKQKLHRVEVVLYVMAEDESDACWVATHARFDVFECYAREAKAIDPGWEDAVPYNADDERTCSEIIKGKKQVIKPHLQSIRSPRPWAVNRAAPGSGFQLN
jgi:hypothetical protein